MKTLVINACYGGFGLSKEAIELGRKLSGNPKWRDSILKGELYPDGQVSTHNACDDEPRDDTILVEVVKQLGEKANGDYAELKLVTVESKYRIVEYDGYETVEEPDSISWSE